MKKYLLFLLILISALGCGRVSREKAVLAKVNNYEITKNKFEEEFKESIYGTSDTLEAKKEFLANLINRKLILQDAQAKGLDKKQGFLRMIERFWEQSLLKLALDNKVEEISGSIAVSDKEIKALYDTMSQDGKISKPYEEIRNQLKREIVRSKESQAINRWVEQLHKNAQIKINDELLKLKIK